MIYFLWSKIDIKPHQVLNTKTIRELEASTHLQSEILQSPFQGISGGKPPVTACAQGKSVEELHAQLWAHSFKLHPVI